MNTDSLNNTMQVIEDQVSDGIPSLKDMAVKPDLKPILERANGYEQPLDALARIYKEDYEKEAKKVLDSGNNLGQIQSTLNYHTTK